MTRLYGVEGTPNIVLIGVPDVAALRQASEMLSWNQIAHFDWHEPDFDLGFTSICTAPLVGAERECLARFKIWKPVLPSWPNGKAGGSTPLHVCSNQTEGTNAPVA